MSQILHLLDPGDIGGRERVVQMLSIAQRRSGMAVCVAAVFENDAESHSFLSPLQEAGIDVLPVRIGRRRYLQERAAVTLILRRVAPAVVHTHGYRPDVVDAAVARSLGIPTATTVHGFTGGGMKNRFYEALQRRALRRFDAVVAVSRSLAVDLARGGVPPDRIHVVPNAHTPIEAPLERGGARAALGIERSEFCIAWVGRLSHEKGPDLFLRALAALRDLPVRASVIGDGSMRQVLAERARALGIADRVRWHGIVPAAARLLRAFDLVVLSSRTEGTPIVLLEAIAAEVPTVTTAVGGVPDVVTSREAWLVPAEDPDALAAAVRQAHAEPRSARERARRARRRLESGFGWERWAARYREIYRRIQPKLREEIPCAR